jgi:hypothetical protein
LGRTAPEKRAEEGRRTYRLARAERDEDFEDFDEDERDRLDEADRPEVDGFADLTVRDGADRLARGEAMDLPADGRVDRGAL